MIGLGAKWGKIPGQQLRNATDGMIGDTFQYMAQVPQSRLQIRVPKPARGGSNRYASLVVHGGKRF
jgi:hypothetical protein